MKKRQLSVISEEWWDYTTLPKKLLSRAARLKPRDLLQLQRPGFTVVFHDTLQDLYTAQALRYLEAWRKATAGKSTGICGPIGPTEQLSLVAQMVNSEGLSLRYAHFSGMDEWCKRGRAVPVSFPLSFERADRQLCFDRILPELAMPESNLHFPKDTNLDEYSGVYDVVEYEEMTGGMGWIAHWAFNDTLRRRGAYADYPPEPDEYMSWGARLVNLHPATVMQNATTSGGGRVDLVPNQALTVGPVETMKCKRVSIFNPGHHAGPFVQRLAALMLGEKIEDSAMPMSLLSRHPDVTFHYYVGGIGTCKPEMH